MSKARYFFFFMILFLPLSGLAAELSLPALSLSEDENGKQVYSVTIQVLAIMTALTLLPSIILMMTSFTRIIIVLGILRQAMGLPQIPTNQILIGISLFLSLFIMMPVLQTAYDTAVNPYMEDEIGPEEALEKAQLPFKNFMLLQTRTADLELFMKLAKKEMTAQPEDLPISIIMPAFLTSELKTAFQIGFLLFIPFLMIDLVIASILMSMGMMMLSPIIISLPFKIMLFILIDGWSLIIGTLASSFGT